MPLFAYYIGLVRLLIAVLIFIYAETFFSNKIKGFYAVFSNPKHIKWHPYTLSSISRQIRERSLLSYATYISYAYQPQ